MAVDLQSSNAQSRDAMCLNRALPGDELFGGQLIAATNFFEAQGATVHRIDDRGLAPRDPTICLRWRQVGGNALGLREDPVLGWVPGDEVLRHDSSISPD